MIEIRVRLDDEYLDTHFILTVSRDERIFNLIVDACCYGAYGEDHKFEIPFENLNQDLVKNITKAVLFGAKRGTPRLPESRPNGIV